MELGRNSDGLSLSGLGSEDDYEGRGTSPSLAPFLARLSRDERLGWTATRSRADDTESLNVNVSDCGSCHLSEVSSVSSWLNDVSAVDDDYSSCAPDDETGSEKDDIDEDEDDNGSEIRPLFLLQRCLEEKLLERQQNSDIVYSDAADSAVSNNSSELNSPQNDKAELETNTMKRASRNLFTFKSSETVDISVPIEGHSVSDTNNALSMPLRRSGSRSNPDSLICTGAIYDFNSTSGKGDIQSLKSEVVNGNTSDTVEVVHNSLSTEPWQGVHKPQCSSQVMRSLPSEAPLTKSSSPVKDVIETPPLCFSSASKHNFTGMSVADSKRGCGDPEQNKSAVDVQQTCIANGSVCHEQNIPSHFSTCKSNNLDDKGTALKANRGSCQSTSLTDFRRSSPSVKSKHQERLHSGAPAEKSVTVMPVEVTKIKASEKANAENVDSASVVSDDAEKASDHACSLVMPMVEDGLSNSDISDVDEAFSMFAGLKPPEPVPVDTSFGARSPVANSKTTIDHDSNTADAHSITNL